jgi:hypothetical protein
MRDEEQNAKKGKKGREEFLQRNNPSKKRKNK